MLVITLTHYLNVKYAPRFLSLHSLCFYCGPLKVIFVQKFRQLSIYTRHKKMHKNLEEKVFICCRLCTHVS